MTSVLTAQINRNGSLRRLESQGVLINLFVGNEMEGGPTNLYLRRFGPDSNAGGILEYIPLLGPASPTRFIGDGTSPALEGHGHWQGLDYCVALVLAEDSAAWFWHVTLANTGTSQERVDLTLAQDIALASYGAIRLNEFYVSQYLDHTALAHPERGVVVATRQNQALDRKFPWSLIGSLRRGTGFATDALQLHGLSLRSGRETSPGLAGELPSRRLQHEHSMVIVRDEPIVLAPGARAAAGFFGTYIADHPAASRPDDLKHVEAVLELPEALVDTARRARRAPSEGENASLFSAPSVLETQELDDASLASLFGTARRHEERDADGALLSFFHGAGAHVVSKRKELRVLRPHGHILRTGLHLTPDESALTSTAWMSGVFHSMIAQGHVSINRFLSTVHSYVGLFRSHGQRVFVDVKGEWRLLEVPSAFEMTIDGCRWLYRYEGGLLDVRAGALSDPHRLTLSIEVREGAPARFLISHHVAMNGDDGSTPGAAVVRREGSAIVIGAASGGDVAYRFPAGTFVISPTDGEFSSVGGDELLYRDGVSRAQPFVCLISEPAMRVGLEISGRLIDAAAEKPLRAASAQDLALTLTSRGTDAQDAVARLLEVAPWFAQNAFIHYLSPRGLEQYSGGGWGTRDVCQGPVELLLALGRIEPIRDLLLRVLRQQNPDGDWPQWFMFFDRERNIRPGDSHGDIVFWPLLVLAQYLLASGDAAVLDERVSFFDASTTASDALETATVWEHAQRALALIGHRLIAGTALAAYGHGDWNDSLQPADPKLREHMCSAWTVVLHHQVLETLAAALRSIGRAGDATPLERSAEAVRRDFQRVLIVDGVLAGYAIFDSAAPDGGSPATPRYLLHPKDDRTGVKYSSLAMIHAILEDMFTPEQTRAHLDLIDRHLCGPDGVRLFDRPMTYHGGPQHLFQRAESATYFGREIGLMYMHAHLRFAQALAHIGAADRFFHALCQANPIGIRNVVPTATLRQANCYYSSSDAAFSDRYEASAEYGRVAQGTIDLDGGWRVYSSGAGIALDLIVRHFLGLGHEANVLCVDPVMPRSVDGLRVSTRLRGKPLDVQYRVGPAGCGVRSLRLNGERVAFTLAINPHRPGAARVPLTAFTAQLSDSNNLLEIDLG